MARAENHTENYYLILGISQSAEIKEIKAAFRRLARQHHPDLNPDNPKAAEKFKLISQAYDVLSDPSKRRRYDRSRPQQKSSAKTQRSSSTPKGRPAPGKTPETALDFYNRGIAKVQNKEYRQAISDYGQAIKLNPRFVDAYLKRCEMLYKLGDNQGVLNDCYEIFNIDPTVAKAYYYQGRARFSLGYVEPAIESYTLAIAQDKNYSQAHYYRGIAYKDQQSNAEAVNDLATAAELFRQQKNYDAYRRTQKIVNELSDGKNLERPDGIFYNFVATLGLSFFNPQGGLLPAFSRLNSRRIGSVGVVYGVLSGLCIFGSYFMIGFSWRLPIFELLFLGLIPFIMMLLTSSLVRMLWHHRGNLQTDIFIAGTAIAPIGIAILLLGFVPGLAWYFILPLIFFGSCYSALTLQAAYVQILNLTEGKATNITVVMLMLNSFLSYFLISSLVL